MTQQWNAEALRESLLWTASSLAALGKEQDVIVLEGRRRTVGEILDEANDALEVDTPPASAQPESMREGYPHDDPQFVALCREHDILGTAMQGLAAVFWRAASAQDDAKDERQAFEAWAEDQGFVLDCDFFEVSGQYYDNDDTQLAYDIWRAARASVAAPAAGDALDRLVDRLAGMAYSFAVRLDQATKGANGDELEGVARRVTADLKAEMRAAIAASQQGGDSE